MCPTYVAEQMSSSPHDALFKDVFGKPEHAELGSFLERVAGSDAKDAIMTAGQRLIDQGVQQGIQQGERALLLRQVKKRFGSQVDPRVEQQMATANPAQIATWAERVLSAATLDELLAD